MAQLRLFYTKFILMRVSFNSMLFYREFEKAFKILLPHEIENLVQWMLEFTKSKPELRYCELKLL